MHSKDQTYVNTKAVDASIRTLQQHNIILLTGKPHSGKTTLALEVAYRFAKTGTLIIYLDTVNDFDRMITCNVQQIVIIENMFGINRPLFIEDLHSKSLEKLRLCVQHKTKIILSSRPLSQKTLESITFTYLFKDKSEIVIDLDTRHKLTGQEKINILKRYMNHYNIASFSTTERMVFAAHSLSCAPSDKLFEELKRMTDDILYKAVSKTDSAIGFPFVCRQFCSHKAFRALGVNFFKSPSGAILSDIDTIRKRGKIDNSFALQYCVFVYIMLKSDLNVNELDKAFLDLIINATYFDRKINYNSQDVKDAIEDSADLYIRYERRNSNVKLQNKAINDIVAFSFSSLSKEAQKLLITSCNWDTLMTFARPYSYMANSNEYMVKIEPDLYLELLRRFINEIFKKRIEAILMVHFPMLFESLRDYIVACTINGVPLRNDVIKSVLRFKNTLHKYSENFEDISEMFQKEMTDTTFLSIDEYSNSFVHYWIVEEFQDKTILFRKILDEIPELLEIMNYNRHTPVHFAIYTRRYYLIEEIFYQWFKNVSRTFGRITFDTEEIQEFIQILRYTALSNIYTAWRSCSKKMVSLFDPYGKELTLLLQNIEDCTDSYNLGKKFPVNEISFRSTEWNSVYIKLNTKILVFYDARHEDVEIKLFCLRKEIVLIGELYIILEENIDSKEGSDNNMSQWIKKVVTFENSEFTIVTREHKPFRCDTHHLLSKWLYFLYLKLFKSLASAKELIL